jgi:RhtB (resistance to homoserine/threonine) family protein
MTEKLVLVVTVTALCMVSPGPDMLLVMRNTLVRDRHYGAMTALGVLTGNLIHIGYCVVGIAVLVSRSPVLYQVLRVAGALYLIYLGIQDLRNASREDINRRSPVALTGSAYRQGFINNLLNPKGSLFYLGVFTQVITPDVSLTQTALLIVVMMTVSTMFWVIFVQTLHLTVVRAGVSGWKTAINRVFGVALILVGARVAMLK